MFVPCPHCGFLLALIVTPGGAAQCCPRCEGPLPAGAGTSPEPATGATADTSEPENAALAPIDAAPDPIATLIANEASAVVPPTGDASAARIPAKASARRRGKLGAPSFARATHAAVPLGPRWPGLLAIALLLLVLVAQLLLVQRDTLAASPRWRPLIARVCTALRCDLPPWHEPAAITMLDRGVQPHPLRPGMLSVQASFRNDARWPQPWPTLLLSLADVDGRAIAQGAFAPREYGAPADATLLAPGQAANIRFVVREPEPRSVAFSFEFR